MLVLSKWQRSVIVNVINNYSFLLASLKNQSDWLCDITNDGQFYV